MRRLAPDGGDVEAHLGAFLKQAMKTNDPHYKADLIAIRYYLRALTQRAASDIRAASAGQTTLLTLVTRLHDLSVSHGIRVCFISFNYDTLLEKAIEDRFGHYFQSLDDYLSAPFPVYKPHGSTNWIQELALSEPSPTRVVYDHFSQIPLAKHWDAGTGGAVEMLDGGQRNVGQGNDRLYVPAVAIPADYKDAFVMPEDHLLGMRTALNETSALLVAGWRASETEFLRICATELYSHLQGLRSYVVDYNKEDPASAGLVAIRNFPHALDLRSTGVWGNGFAEFANSEDFDWEVRGLIDPRT
ncbi:MAG: hypothetical protein JWO98_3367 [Frankiales bacterium]|nr:hypothetical protein [Frankiales bacterium]